MIPFFYTHFWAYLPTGGGVESYEDDHGSACIVLAVLTRRGKNITITILLSGVYPNFRFLPQKIVMEEKR